MTGSERREQIRSKLSQTQVPVSATTLAKQFNVSRQTIVGDISLLRAHGTAIVATLQ
ncbi:MAG: HTH domain-containing protein, partial [Lactiplantibacillus plantarum]|nr:HTH domain-containing protein [Lactiplantibacillus plantarum]